MATTIYYFSGTGNSLKIAKDLSSSLKNSRIVRICKDNLKITSDKLSEKIGFVFPVYYRGLPRLVETFIERLEINPETYFFAVANFGSYAALTFKQIDEILKAKGGKLAANFGVAMPGSMWFMYYPHSKEDYVSRINNQKASTLEIANEVTNNVKIDIPEVKDEVKEKKMYDDFKPSYTDEKFWTSDKCTGCGMCVKVCPAENIEIIDEKPVWKHKCEQCLACLHWCPNTAIEYKMDSLGKERYHNPHINMPDMFIFNRCNGGDR